MSYRTPEFPIPVEQGANMSFTFQWLNGGKIIAPIEFLEVGYPTIFTVTGHGLNAITPHPVIISGVDGCEHVNSIDTQITRATRIDADKFSMPLSTVADEWIEGTGEMTYFAPTDMTDFTGVCNIRKNWHSTTILHTISTALGTMTLNSVDGSIQLDISAADTLAFTFVNAVYDVDLTAPGGYITRVFRGPVELFRDI